MMTEAIFNAIPRPNDAGGMPKFWFGERVYITDPYRHPGTVYGVKLNPVTGIWQYSVLGDGCTNPDGYPEFQLAAFTEH